VRVEPLGGIDARQLIDSAKQQNGENRRNGELGYSVGTWNDQRVWQNGAIRDSGSEYRGKFIIAGLEARIDDPCWLSSARFWASPRSH
jgi:hypothetical protein